MLEIHHFSYGWVTPVLAYIMSVTGSLLGLRCTARARTGDGRAGWLIAASIAIGGTGIWVMHFVAMLGFTIHGATIRYNIPITLLSAAIAVVAVWSGLSIVARGKGFGRLLAGGTVTGLAVGAMHYSGMYAMKTDAVIDYNAGLVTLSMVIAVVAATVALWFTLVITGIWATVAAALIMGVAVCGMHYTGMASMSAHMSDHATTPSGASAMGLLAPFMVTVSVVTLVLLIHVGLTEVDERAMLPEPALSPAAAPEARSTRSDRTAAQQNSTAVRFAAGAGSSSLAALHDRPGQLQHNLDALRGNQSLPQRNPNGGPVLPTGGRHSGY
ncbi:MHYT domain-containing protein [Nocardia sp. NPDC088792]|uniref:MHYT domain-containing protein n=1 Tax=Nocardia sp. NPDC088792 TaxID=3364332 RepID=UPI0038040C82